MRRVLNLALLALFLFPALARAQTINCPSGFTLTDGQPCTVSTVGEPENQAFAFLGGGVTTVVGTQAQIIQANVGHVGNSMMYQTAVNAQAFSTTFTFVPDGWNIAFTLNNQNTNNAGSGPQFVAGAGFEAGFYQYCCEPYPPNNIFALELDSASPDTDFQYSTAQIYQIGQTPEIPVATGGVPGYVTNKVSTSPVPLNSPSGTEHTTTGDTYSVTLNYTGTNLIMNMYDVTAGGSCPGASCFSHTWPFVYIPSLVSGTTAYVGFTGGYDQTSGGTPLYVNSFVYNVLSAASTPTFSPVAGDYGSTQSVTISASTGPTICYNFTGAPATDGTTGCTNGTLYTGAISVPSGRTIYAVAGGTGYGDSNVAAAPYQIGSTASSPTFSGSSGTYQGTQYIQLQAAQGGVICYNTTGSPATNGSTGCTTGTKYTTPITISSSETLYAIAGGTGFTDSAVSSAAYVINLYTGTATLPVISMPGNTGAAPANAPQFSPVPGAYSGTQSVTLSTTSSGGYICYNVATTGISPALFPEPDSQGGCLVGTLYSNVAGPVSVATGKTLYAIAGINLNCGSCTIGPPSTLVAGSYTAPSGPTPTPTPTATPTPSPTPTPIQCVNISGGNACGPTPAAFPTITTTARNTLVVTSGSHVTGGSEYPATVTDTANDFFTSSPCGPVSDGVGDTAHELYAFSINGGATVVTMNLTGGSGTCRYDGHLCEWPQSSGLDKCAATFNGTGESTLLTGTTPMTTNANDFMVGATAHVNGLTINTGSPTQGFTEFTDPADGYLWNAWNAVNSTGLYFTTWQITP